MVKKNKYKIIKIVRPDKFGQKVETENVERNRKITKAKKIINESKKRFMSSKILKKPTAKLTSYSPEKFVAQLAQSQGSLVHEIQNRYANPPQDNRSQFFRESFQEEKRKAFGGFL